MDEKISFCIFCIENTARSLGISGTKMYDKLDFGIANDRVFDTIELCLEGLISKDEALGRLKYQKPNNQIYFISQKVLDKTLRFIESYEVKNGK